jgi:very-short-patch-repair endonuclease
MGGFGAARRRVQEIARRQQGAVTFTQLIRCGLSARQIERAVARGELLPLHRGVYLLGQILLPYSPEMAAMLACGPKAAVSHRSGIHLYGLLLNDAPPRPVHVTVHGRHVRGDDGILVHETSSLLPYEVRERHDIPVTAPIRMLIDFAGDGCTDAELDYAVAEAFALNLTNRAAVLREVSKHPGRRGVGRLSALLDARPPARTRSRPERRLLVAVRRAGLPEPETDVKIGRWTVDFLWRGAALVVEVDAYSTHSSPWAFERDRRKDAELAALGFSVQRFTADMIRDDMPSVIAWIAARLAAASSAGRPRRGRSRRSR